MARSDIRSSIEIIRRYSERPIAFLPIYARITGSITAGLMLSQCKYWAMRAGEDGWWYKTMDEWQAETAMSRAEIESARRRLVQLGILEYERRGLPAKGWYRLNWERLATILLEADALEPDELDEPEPCNQDREYPANWMASEPDGESPANQIAEFQRSVPPDSGDLYRRNPAVYLNKESETTSESTSEKIDSCLADGETSGDVGLDSASSVSSESWESAWEEFRSLYPRRGTRAMGWSRAKQKFLSLVRREPKVLPALLAGVAEYRKEMVRTGKMGTEYVAMPLTWLNQRRWEDYQNLADLPAPLRSVGQVLQETRLDAPPPPEGTQRANQTANPADSKAIADAWRQFMERYPPRETRAMGWRNAYHAFLLALEEGATLDHLVHSAESYARECHRSGATGTSRVLMPERFLREGRWRDYEPSSPVKPIEPESPVTDEWRIEPCEGGYRILYHGAPLEGVYDTRTEALRSLIRYRSGLNASAVSDGSAG